MVDWTKLTSRFKLPAYRVPLPSRLIEEKNTKMCWLRHDRKKNDHETEKRTLAISFTASRSAKFANVCACLRTPAHKPRHYKHRRQRYIRCGRQRIFTSRTSCLSYPAPSARCRFTTTVESQTNAKKRAPRLFPEFISSFIQTPGMLRPPANRVRNPRPPQEASTRFYLPPVGGCSGSGLWDNSLRTLQ